MEDKPTKEDFRQMHDDPANWFLGIFYFNKKDPRLFPPKRIKYFGWTVNWANPMSIIALLALLFVFSFFIRLIK